jgi:aspartyl-tRNA(Asn)/glutamyl-tRNA(Gln) amidotransferase subunit A
MKTTPSSLREAAALIQRRELSPVDLTRACLDRIAARNDTLRAFITVMTDTALREATHAEEQIARGHYVGPLHGIPVSVKDLVDVAGTPTTSASNVPARHPTHDAPVVANLRRAGAIIVGKTNLHEFAFGTTGDETAFGAIHNPIDPTRSAGGSSSGAAAALVERMCYGSVGTDTGGSIRIPAAACGVVGLKPTHGEVPAGAVVPLSASLDHVGPLALTVDDADVMFQAMRDGRARDVVATNATALWLGVPTEYFFDKLDAGVRRSFQSARAALEHAGHSVTDVRVAHAAHTPEVYVHISLPEAAWYHVPLLAAHADKYSPGVRLRLEMGRYVLAEDYLRAMQARAVLRRAVDRSLEGIDALVLPTLPIAAPPLGAASVDVDGSKEPVRAMMLRLTQLFDITGHPAIAIPCGRGADGLPHSLQLVGHRGHTDDLLGVAAVVERQLADWGSVGGGAG